MSIQDYTARREGKPRLKTQNLYRGASGVSKSILTADHSGGWAKRPVAIKPQLTADSRPDDSGSLGLKIALDHGELVIFKAIRGALHDCRAACVGRPGVVAVAAARQSAKLP